MASVHVLLLVISIGVSEPSVPHHNVMSCVFSCRRERREAKELSFSQHQQTLHVYESGLRVSAFIGHMRRIQRAFSHLSLL